MKKLSFLLLTVVVLLMAWPLNAKAATISSDTGDRVEIFNDIKVDSPALGSVIAIFGDIDVNNSVAGEVVAIFGDVRVNSKVSGQVVTIFGDIRMTDKAVVYGNAVSLGRLERNSGSKLYGQEVNVNFGFLPFGSATLVIIAAAFGVVLLIIGLPLLLIFSKRFTLITASLDFDMGRRMTIGFLLFIASVLLLPLLTITVIGLLLYGLMVVVAEIIGCTYFGRVVLRTEKAKENLLLQFFTGFLIINVIKVIFALVSFQVGFLWPCLLLLILSAAIISFGFGVLFDTRLGQSKKSNEI